MHNNGSAITFWHKQVPTKGAAVKRTPPEEEIFAYRLPIQTTDLQIVFYNSFQRAFWFNNSNPFPAGLGVLSFASFYPLH